MAPFTLGLILGGIWRQPRQSKVMIEWTADMPRKARQPGWCCFTAWIATPLI
jgi:hypothetical protein